MRHSPIVPGWRATLRHRLGKLEKQSGDGIETLEHQMEGNTTTSPLLFPPGGETEYKLAGGPGNHE